MLGPYGTESSESMVIFLTIMHVIVCLVLIGVILLQQGSSSDLAGAFGGQGSQTAFGPRGASNLLTKVTAWAAVIFMLTSIGLTVLVARQSTGHSVLQSIGSSTPAKK
jgi:preprotein translocase subunit SecG